MFCLCLSKTLAIIKPIAVTQLSDSGEMETVADIKIYLTKLQRLNEYFGVSEIQEEVTFQLGQVKGFSGLVLIKNGAVLHLGHSAG